MTELHPLGGIHEPDGQRRATAPNAVWMRASTSPVTLLVGMLLVPVTPAMAQSFGIEMRMGVTYLRAYGGGGAGPDVGIAVRLPGRIFGARPRVGLAVSAADLPLVGAVGPFVDGDHRRLQLVVGDVGFEWPVTTRVRAHVAGVLGRLESVVPSFSVVTAAGARPANHAGEARGMVAGVEAGVRLALVPGLFLDFVAAGLKQRAYADDPVFMPAFRLRLGVVPAL